MALVGRLPDEVSADGRPGYLVVVNPGAQADAVRMVVVLVERPPASVLMALHRLLGLGVMDVRRRIDAGTPLLDRELFGNDRLPLAALLRSVMELIEPYEHTWHECLGADPPGVSNRIGAEESLRLIVEDVPAPEFPPRPVPAADLVDPIVVAARATITELRATVDEPLCVVALVTTGEGTRPYLSVTVDGPDRWDLAGSPHALAGDERFAEVTEAWNARGDLSDLSTTAADAEHDLRLASMEEALRRLDGEGLFGRGVERERALLLVETMPPCPSAVGYARRLNPFGPLLRDWLVEASECPPLLPDPTATAELGGSAEMLAPAPNPTIAALWRATPGIDLPDGRSFYGPHSLAERNETYEVAAYAPGWVLVGDDGGGRGFLMRRTGPAFDPVRGREAAEVFRLDLGALCEQVKCEGEFVTDDLCGWLVR